jgi:hypothetical protein
MSGVITKASAGEPERSGDDAEGARRVNEVNQRPVREFRTPGCFGSSAQVCGGAVGQPAVLR